MLPSGKQTSYERYQMRVKSLIETLNRWRIIEISDKNPKLFEEFHFQA